MKILIVLLFPVLVFAASYEYKGFYNVSDVFYGICESCILDLPPDYLKTEIYLNVSSDKKSQVLKALVRASHAAGWTLKHSGGVYVVEPIQNEGNLIFISCFDNQVKNVPKFAYVYERKADSVRCYQRDSLAFVAQMLADSLASVPPLDFKAYTLKYYNFNKAFSDKMGVKWGDILWLGTLHDVHFFDSWTSAAVESNDTSFSYRSVSFALDSSIVLNWGTEEQAQLRTFNDNGIISTEYEWRKYGLEITIKAQSSRVHLDYVFREKDANTTILSGSVVGSPGDTLVISGDYQQMRDINRGVPGLSRIPFFRLFFSEVDKVAENRKFYIYLIPNGGKNEN